MVFVLIFHHWKSKSYRLLESLVVDSSLDEYEQEAKLAKFETIEALRTALVAREKHEAEQAELERLRQAEIERQQKNVMRLLLVKLLKMHESKLKRKLKQSVNRLKN